MAIRGILVGFHRYVGLGMALFLVLAGLTGSFLVWHDEIDAALNPRWFHTSFKGEVLPPGELARAFERQAPGASLTLIRPPEESGRTVEASMRGWPLKSANGGTINQVFLEPTTGEILGVRSTVKPGLNRGEIVRWIYRFHYSLTIGDIGSYIIGYIALAWFFDAFVGFYLTLPRGKPFWKKWKPAWVIKRSRLNHDLHRASGLWLWPVFAMLAFTGVYLNLTNEVFKPVVSVFSKITPQPYNEPALPKPVNKPTVLWDEAIRLADTAMAERGVERKLAYISHSPARAYYTVAFATPNDLARGRAGARVYIDSRDGHLRQLELEGTGTAGDVLVDWQFPLHSGKVLGLPGRILIFIAGIVVAGLSITGVIIWARKLRARLARKAPTPQAFGWWRRPASSARREPANAGEP